MAFLIYKRTVQGDGLRYDRLKPLKFAGADGLIARHVKTLPSKDQGSWKLKPEEIFQLAGVALPSVDLAVLFDVSTPDATSVCLYELAKIHGSCRDTSTQLALDFNVVVDREFDGDVDAFAKSFVAPFTENRKRLAETLALSGGPGGGTWKWTTPGMNLGTAVVSPHCRGTDRSEQE